MSIRLKIQVLRKVTGTDVYHVSFSVLDATGITPSVFVVGLENKDFSHVASLKDITETPNFTAGLVGYSYARVPSMSKEFNSIAQADDFVTVTKSRINTLVGAWKAYEANFTFTETLVYEVQ